MATIRIRRSGVPLPESVNASPAESLLSALLKANVPIRHDCGGKSLCGTCRVRVLSGERGLSPLLDRESLRLAACQAAPDERLACQTHAVRDAEIEPLVPLKESEAPQNEG